jgi:hypothetical protein
MTTTSQDTDGEMGGASVRKSGPVSVLCPYLEGPRPRPVHVYSRPQKNRTGPQKTAEDRFFSVLGPVLVLTGFIPVFSNIITQ